MSRRMQAPRAAKRSRSGWHHAEKSEKIAGPVVFIFGGAADSLAGLARLFQSGAGQCVCPFVVRMTSMSLDPTPFDGMAGSQCIQATPQIFILHGLFAGRFPAALLPAVYP